MRRRASEQGAARPGWLLALAGVLFAVVVAGLARQRIGGGLGWAKEHWLSATTLSTAAAVAGVLAPFVIRWLDRRRPGQAVEATHDPAATARNAAAGALQVDHRRAGALAGPRRATGPWLGAPPREP
jgi:hypothetical protein